MESSRFLLLALLTVEAILFVPGLPAWGQLDGMSMPSLAFLLLLGICCGLGATALQAGQPSARIFIWAAAAANLVVFPWLTPVGLAIAVLLLLLVKQRASAVQVRTPRQWYAAVASVVAGSWWVWLLCLGFCWAAASQVHRFAATTGLPVARPLPMFAGLAVAAPLSALVHRLGHWMAGAWVDLESMGAWAGWADPQPAVYDGKRLQSRLLVWTLGGPLASLAWAAAGLLALILGNGRAWADVAELAGLSSVCSLAVCLVSLLPWRCLGYRSDGATLVVIVRHGAEYRRDRAVALLAGEWRRGVRASNWDPRMLRAAAAVPDLSSQHATACGLNYLHCLDRGSDASARYWIGRLAEGFAAERLAVPVRWRLEVAFFLAAFDGSSRVAEAVWWRRAAGHPSPALQTLRLRCDAALALVAGDADLARLLATKAERAVLGTTDARCLESELDLLDCLRERLNPALPQPTKTAPSMVHSEAV